MIYIFGTFECMKSADMKPLCGHSTQGKVLEHCNFRCCWLSHLLYASVNSTATNSGSRRSLGGQLMDLLILLCFSLSRNS